MFKLKNRSVTIRLSEEEYQLLLRECVQQGASSLSELARVRLFRADPVQEEVRNLLHKLDEDIQNMGGALKLVSEQLLVSPPGRNLPELQFARKEENL